MGICVTCKQFGGPHRFEGQPCPTHANRSCFSCWKQHLESIVKEGTVITCLQCSAPLAKSQVQAGAKKIFEYVMELKCAVAAQEAADESAKLSAKKGDKENEFETGAGEGNDDGEADFVLIEKEDAVGAQDEDWELVDTDDN